MHDRPAPRLEQALNALFRGLLRLYPVEFRSDFEAEIGAVFADALAARREAGAGALLKVFGRELSGLPVALAREYSQVSRERQTKMTNIPSRTKPAPTGQPQPATPQPWTVILLAVLPYLLIMWLDLPHLLSEMGWLANSTSSWLQTLTIITAALIVLACAGALLVSWRRKTLNSRHALWAASWYPIFGLGSVLAILFLIGALVQAAGFPIELNQGILVYLLIFLSVAILLYLITRLDPLSGLLAVMPGIVLFWHMVNEEFVPDIVEIPLRLAALAVACLAVAIVLRRGNWRFGLPVFLAGNFVIGLLFSYMGIYHGGTLPSSAPGPSPIEVLRSLIPQYLATSALIFGPLFARRYRQIGRAAPHIGQPAYHLALASLLLLTLTYLTAVVVGMESPQRFEALFSDAVLHVILILALAGYLAGVMMLFRSAYASGASASQLSSRSGVEVGLLVLLPLGLPFALLTWVNVGWKWPISTVAGIPFLWGLPGWLLFSVGLAWLALSAWVILQEPTSSAPPEVVEAV